MVEQDDLPVVVMKPAKPYAPTISEIIASMEAAGTSGIVDEDFAADVQKGIAGRNEPWVPPSWD